MGGCDVGLVVGLAALPWVVLLGVRIVHGLHALDSGMPSPVTGEQSHRTLQEIADSEED